MCSTPAMSKQSDQEVKGANRSLRKLCVMGGLNYVFCGSADYTDYTDWK